MGWNAKLNSKPISPLLFNNEAPSSWFFQRFIMFDLFLEFWSVQVPTENRAGKVHLASVSLDDIQGDNLFIPRILQLKLVINDQFLIQVPMRIICVQAGGMFVGYFYYKMRPSGLKSCSSHRLPRNSNRELQKLGVEACVDDCKECRNRVCVWNMS